MDSPRSGFRRASAASWALAGLGISGVAGASVLAYADTVKPTVADAPAIATDPPPAQFIPAPRSDASGAPLAYPPQAPVTAVTTDPPAQVAPELTATPSPSDTPPPIDTPKYTPQSTQRSTQATPAPTTQESRASSVPPTTKRRSLTPTTVVGPNYSPRITISRGS